MMASLSDKDNQKHSHRKDEHLSLGIDQWRSMEKQNGFDSVTLNRPVLPLIKNGENVVPSTDLFGVNFKWPFWIEAMTGGTLLTGKINGELANIAKKFNLAMAVGSQSIALKNSQAVETFSIARKNNPSGFLIANIGIGHSAQDAKDAVTMIDANALEVHINAAQEISMRDGEYNFEKWLESLSDIISKSDVPVIVKEVGFGMSVEDIQQISKLSPDAINIAGSGGTDFGAIEERRNRSPLWNDYSGGTILSNRKIGITTLDSLKNAQLAKTDIPIIANGGITSTLDILKSFAFGASMAGIAGYFLYQNSQHRLESVVENWQEQLPLLMKMYAINNMKKATSLI